MSDALEKRTSLFQEILAISGLQLDICQWEDLNPENLEGLSQLINQRQALMDEIDRLNSSLLPGMASFETAAAATDDAVDSGHRYPVRNNELQKVMEAIRQNDESCRKLLRNKSRELASRIKETRVNRQAVDAYNQTNSINEAWFVDKKK